LSKVNVKNQFNLNTMVQASESLLLQYRNWQPAVLKLGAQLEAKAETSPYSEAVNNGTMTAGFSFTGRYSLSVGAPSVGQK
jgi:hypothetical protein